MHWKKITLIGVGLLGGSLGLALKQRRLADRVVGFVRRDSSKAECLRLKVVDEATLDLQAAVRDADLIIFCTPLAQMRGLLKAALPAIRKGAIITDVGSVKAGGVRELEPLARKAGAHFVGGHPMAGGETAGAAAAKVDLFNGAVCIITPTKHTAPVALRKINQLWLDVGAQTMQMTPTRHDQLVARSSHLPHLLAAALAQHVLDPKHGEDQARLCASGFRDTTRVASGSPVMWRDIALANRRNLLRELKSLEATLAQLRQALETEDGMAAESFFDKARIRRDAWVTQSQPASSE